MLIVSGHRIGKGEGFADLEFAMMRAMEAVDGNIIVVTTVHESQITDIPKELMQPHDLTVDYIVTPDEIIECPRHEKPEGVIWSMLTKEKLSRIPILQKLRARQREAGVDVTLKDGDKADVSESNPDEKEEKSDKRQRDRRRRRKNPRARRESDKTDGEKGEHSESGEVEDKEGRRRRNNNNNRRRRRRSNRKSEGDGGDGDTGAESGGDGDKENMGEDQKDRRRRRPQRRRRRSTNKSRDGDHSGDEERGEEKDRGEGRPRRRQNSGPLSTVYVGALPRSLRVSEFKAQVRDRGVNPLRVIWHGASGHAFLQFQKKDEADGALNTLKDLEIDGRALKVEMSRRGGKGSPDEAGDDTIKSDNDIKAEVQA